MTSCLLSLALVFTPAPFVAPKEDHVWQPIPSSLASVSTAEDVSMAEFWPYPMEEPAPSFTATTTLPPPEPPPPPPKTPAELVDEIFGWPGRQLVTCESAWNRWAVGPFGERSYFQIHPVHARPGGIIERLGYTWDDMWEPEANIRVAAEIRRVQGLRAWTCWKG